MSEEEVLKRLADIRNNVNKLRKYHSDEWIMREVLASMALSKEAVEHTLALDETNVCDCANTRMSLVVGGICQVCQKQFRQ